MKSAQLLTASVQPNLPRSSANTDKAPEP